MNISTKSTTEVEQARQAANLARKWESVAAAQLALWLVWWRLAWNRRRGRRARRRASLLPSCRGSVYATAEPEDWLVSPAGRRRGVRIWGMGRRKFGIRHSRRRADTVGGTVGSKAGANAPPHSSLATSAFTPLSPHSHPTLTFTVPVHGL
jgi:hypothetical protein